MSERVRRQDAASSTTDSPDRLRSITVPVVLIDVAALVVGIVPTAAAATFPALFGFLLGLSCRVLLDDLGRKVRATSGRTGTMARISIVAAPIAIAVALASNGAADLVAAAVFGGGVTGVVMRITRG